MLLNILEIAGIKPRPLGHRPKMKTTAPPPLPYFYALKIITLVLHVERFFDLQQKNIICNFLVNFYCPLPFQL